MADKEAAKAKWIAAKWANILAVQHIQEEIYRGQQLQEYVKSFLKEHKPSDKMISEWHLGQTVRLASLEAKEKSIKTPQNLKMNEIMVIGYRMHVTETAAQRPEAEKALKEACELVYNQKYSVIYKELHDATGVQDEKTGNYLRKLQTELKFQRKTLMDEFLKEHNPSDQIISDMHLHQSVRLAGFEAAEKSARTPQSLKMEEVVVAGPKIRLLETAMPSSNYDKQMYEQNLAFLAKAEAAAVKTRAATRSSTKATKK
jgi:hypothetical protein